MADPKHDVVRSLGAAAAKSSFPVGVTLWAWLGQNLPTIVAMVTLVYLGVQIGHLLWKWDKERRAEADNKAAINKLMAGRIARAGERERDE